MNETEFLQHSDALFQHIEDEIDEHTWDIDCHFSGNVLTLETANGTQIVINRHTPNQELWIASKTGGYHFSWQEGAWLTSKDKQEFFATLNQVLSQASEENIDISVFSA